MPTGASAQRIARIERARLGDCCRKSLEERNGGHLRVRNHAGSAETPLSGGNSGDFGAVETCPECTRAGCSHISPAGRSGSKGPRRAAREDPFSRGRRRGCDCGHCGYVRWIRGARHREVRLLAAQCGRRDNPDGTRNAPRAGAGHGGTAPRQADVFDWREARVGDADWSGHCGDGVQRIRAAAEDERFRDRVRRRDGRSSGAAQCAPHPDWRGGRGGEGARGDGRGGRHRSEYR